MDAEKVKRLKDVKEKLKEHQDMVKHVESIKRGLEEEIMDDLDSDGSSLTRTDYGTVSIISETVAQVTDWDAFYAYVMEHNAFYLMQRRVGNPAWRDECESRGKVPGTEPFIKRKLSFTNKTT